MKKSASNDTEDTKLEDPEDYYAMDKCQLLHEVHRLNEALLEAQMWLQEEYENVEELTEELRKEQKITSDLKEKLSEAESLIADLRTELLTTRKELAEALEEIYRADDY